MKCPRCHSEVNPGAKFCIKCGYNLQDAKPDLQPSAVLPEPRPDNKKKIGLMILIVVLLAAGVGAGVWFALRKSSQPDYQEVLATANRYYNKLDYINAEDYYLQSQQLDPKQKEPYIKLYEIYQITEEPEKAVDIQNLAYENLDSEDYSDVQEQMNQIDLNLSLSANTQDSEEEETAQEETTEQEAEEETQEAEETLEQINARARKKYQTLLQSIYSTQMVGDSSLAFFGDDGSQIEEDKFMTADITGNGIEELIFLHTNTYMAGMAGFIYGYDPDLDEYYQIYRGSSFLTPYDNGWLKLEASHNQSRYIFWPFELYKYNETSRKYESVLQAYGTDPQSDSQDIDGNGEVVKIAFTDGSADLYMDNSEFDAWFENYIGHGTEVSTENLEFMTPENIQSLAS